MAEDQPRRIDSPAALRKLYDTPSALSQQKFLNELDAHCIAVIAHSSFFCLATMHADGSLDVSPRGDPPGPLWFSPRRRSCYRIAVATTGSTACPMRRNGRTSHCYFWCPASWNRTASAGHRRSSTTTTVSNKPRLLARLRPQECWCVLPKPVCNAEKR